MVRTKNTKNLKVPLLIIALISVSFLVRISGLKNNLFFGFEQGRDFIKMSEIVSGDLTLIGPKTDISGVFHGALSYYIPLIPYLISKGDPYGVIMFYIFMHSISIIFLYLSSKELFSKKVGILTVTLYAFSYSAIIYSRWLSNPNLVPVFGILYFYFLVRSKRNWKYLLGVTTTMSFMVHLMVVVPLAFLIPTIIFLKVEKIKLNISKIFILVIPIVMILSTYLLFETRNEFLMIKSLFHQQTLSGSLLSSGIEFVNQFYNEIIDGLVPSIPRLSFLVFIIVFIYAIYSIKNSSNLLHVITFLLSVPILFTFISDAPLRHFFITTSIFLSMLIAVVADRLFNESHRLLSIILIVMVIFGNIYTIQQRLPSNEANFIHHAQRTYIGDMKNVIDYIYTESNGKEFTYDYYSVPYWKEDAWIYLFSWYGKTKYKYAPKIDRTNSERSEIFYTIIEPNESVQVHKDNWYGEYKKDLILLESTTFGHIEVEKRK